MSQTAPCAEGPAKAPFWGRTVAWLMFLGPLFFLSYGFSNQLAAAKAVDQSIFFDWERHIPFLPWTIVPYWSIDLLYGLSFLLCCNRLELDRHALRLLTTQIISVACFLAFPLHFAFERPHVEGFFGALFDALMDFDKPYNQAPSLHISLLVIIWARFHARVPQGWRITVNIWAVLIGLSVLTTYQHHFIDVPTGVLVGLLCVWMWPSSGQSPLAQNFVRKFAATTAQHRKLAAYYLFGALLLAAGAFAVGGFALWLLWGSASLTLVALIYAGIGAERGFQKSDGQHKLAITLLFAPYLLGAWINSRLWTRKHPAPDAIADGVWLGRLPRAHEMHNTQFAALVDLTAELAAPRGNWLYAGLPMLDLIAPEPGQLTLAAQHIEALRQRGPVLVCCALGRSRSACAVIAWLLLTRRITTLDAAEALLRTQRPAVVIGPEHRAALARWVAHV